MPRRWRGKDVVRRPSTRNTSPTSHSSTSTLASSGEPRRRSSMSVENTLYPKSAFDLAGLGPRLCAFLSLRVETTRGRAATSSGNGNGDYDLGLVCAGTLSSWRDTLLPVTIQQLSGKHTISELSDILGLKTVNTKTEKGIAPLLASHVAYAIKDKKLGWQTARLSAVEPFAARSSNGLRCALRPTQIRHPRRAPYQLPRSSSTKATISAELPR